MQCSECHVVPTDLTHASQPLTVTFATAAGDIAKNDGLAPAWTSASLTCASAYCHGASLSGGTAITPVWTTLDGTYAACTSCHGNPPTANAHVQCSKDFCNVCHLGTLPGGRLDLTAKTHLNGVVDLLPKAQWGTVNHGIDSQPTGHPDGISFTACTVCHATAMTCLTCHDPVP
jgi:predicted CxxxxCH...CXXCH cytochrome family protein